ncbi:hypothetical protein LIER_02453 [Lithospermum erythrorhizon]|uniref:Uncharacterized protein n=1 Tax=Lithospermum erythrorhizon TaxID=34254 RepID=A0AAV3NU47_LITER
MRPSVDDAVEDTIAKGMYADILSIIDIEPVTTKATDEGVIRSVTDAETAGSIERPTVSQGIDDTLDVDIQEVIPEEGSQKKKSKKRKHKKMVDASETSEPKNKLSKEEKAAKRARKVERKDNRAVEKAAEAEAAEDDVSEEAEESVPE